MARSLASEPEFAKNTFDIAPNFALRALKELHLSGYIFKSDDPAPRAKAIVEATTHFNDPAIIAKVSRGLGDPMSGLAVRAIPEKEQLAVRGW